MKLVISIPVHECAPCVINQVESIRQFVPSCAAVVLHVSGDYSEPNLYETLMTAAKKDYDGFLFINSTRHRTFKAGESANVTGLSTIWCDNFRFMSKIMNFDFYSMATSNELFVRSGLENLMEKYTCQYDIRNPPTRPDRIPHANSEWETVLKNKYGCQYPEFGVCEGSFFPFHIWKRVSDIVLDELSQESLMPKNLPLGVNEYILPTLFFTLYPELYKSIVPETYVFGPKDYNPNAPWVLESIVRDVKEGKHPNQFVVKRVPRQINHPIRIFINNLNKG